MPGFLEFESQTLRRYVRPSLINCNSVSATFRVVCCARFRFLDTTIGRSPAASVHPCRFFWWSVMTHGCTEACAPRLILVLLRRRRGRCSFYVCGMFLYEAPGGGSFTQHVTAGGLRFGRSSVPVGFQAARKMMVDIRCAATALPPPIPDTSHVISKTLVRKKLQNGRTRAPQEFHRNPPRAVISGASGWLVVRLECSTTCDVKK